MLNFASHLHLNCKNCDGLLWLEGLKEVGISQHSLFTNFDQFYNIPMRLNDSE